MKGKRVRTRPLEIRSISPECGESFPEGGWVFLVARIVPAKPNCETVILLSWCPDEETAREAITLLKRENGGKFVPQFERVNGVLVRDKHRMLLDFKPDRQRVEGYAEVYPSAKCNECGSWGHDERTMYGERPDGTTDRTISKCEFCKRELKRKDAERLDHLLSLTANPRRGAPIVECGHVEPSEIDKIDFDGSSGQGVN